MDESVVEYLFKIRVACLKLVADLKKTDQIATALGISPSTVNTKIERAMDRRGVTTRRKAARIVMAHTRIGFPAAQTRSLPERQGCGESDA